MLSTRYFNYYYLVIVIVLLHLTIPITLCGIAAIMPIL